MAGTAPREELGPYLIYDRIGVGGMASVDRAVERGIEGVDRIVALKRLLPHLVSDESIVRAFVREAKLGSQLQHANIVQTYTFGRVGTAYFIAFEYVDGCHLRQILRHARVAGPPPISVTIAIVRQICDALEYAHTRKDLSGRPLRLVHRDVSPANLLITRSGHLKVIDFGIAQSLTVRTTTRRIEGKLAYMSPEALAGEPLDHRSDLFSLGVVFHELLTARPLFPQTNDPTRERDTIKPPASVRDSIPPALDAIVMRALATEPEERWSSAAELRAALFAASPASAAPNEVAAWCAPVFASDASGPIELPFDSREITASDSAPAIVLDDVPDYAEFALNQSTMPGVEPYPQPKWRRIDTIETVPPPPIASTPPGARSNAIAATPPRARRVTPVSQPPGERVAAEPAPRASRGVAKAVARLVYVRAVVAGVAGVTAIGIAFAIGRTTSRVTAPAPAPPPEPPAATVVLPSTSAVTLETTPAGATIVVGTQPPHTGSPWSLQLAPGSYPIEVRAPDHDPWTTTLVVRAGEARSLTIALAPNRPPAVASATLAIDSTPPGLEVLLDGQPLVNRTPIRTGVVPGPHSIVVRSSGADVWTTEFTAKDNQSHRFTATATPKRPEPAAPAGAPDAATAVAPTEPAPPVGDHAPL